MHTPHLTYSPTTVVPLLKLPVEQGSAGSSSWVPADLAAVVLQRPPAGISREAALEAVLLVVLLPSLGHTGPV